jgi:hypothetical protein
MDPRLWELQKRSPTEHEIGRRERALGALVDV